MKIIFMTALIFSTMAFADLKVYDVSDGGRKEIFSSKLPKSEGFFDNSEKYKIYGARFELKEFKNQKPEVLQKDDGLDLVITDKESYVLIGVGKGSMQIKNNLGVVKKYEFEWSPLQSSMVSNTCGAKAPAFFLSSDAKAELKAGPKTDSKTEPPQKDPQIQKLPFLLGVNCRLENKNLQITVSTLSSVEWLESSMFEAAGKSERWRDYQVPAWPPNGGTIATLKLKYKGQVYNLDYVAPKSGENKQKDAMEKSKKQLTKQFENTVKLSSTALALSADSASTSDSKFALGYQFLSHKIYDMIRVGGFFDTSLEISKKEEALSFLEILAHGDYVYTISDEFDIFAGLAYQYADFQQKSTAARMQNSQLGVILGTQYLFNPDNRIYVQVYKTTFSSKTIKSNLGLSFDYKYKLGDENSPYWIGLFYKMQNFDAVNDAGASRQFKETQMGLSLSF